MATLRWMLRRDEPEVLAIAAQTPFRLDSEKLNGWMRRANCIGYVAEHSERVIGFVIIQHTRRRYGILHLAVHAGFRQHGVAGALLEKLESQLTAAPGRRNVIDAMIPESDLEMLQFFRHMGYHGSLVRDAFIGEDGVRMRLDARAAVVA